MSTSLKHLTESKSEPENQTIPEPVQFLAPLPDPVRGAKLLICMSLLMALVGFALYLRVFDITVRPLHSDESVNFLLYETTNREGYYPYSHENYHGPLFFYLITWTLNTFGDSILDLRGVSIAAGTLSILILAALVPLEGWAFAIIGALLLAVSPSAVFFSRYAIHEPLFVLETLALAICAFYWCRTKSPIAIYAGALCVAALVATKETFPICVCAILLGMLSVSGWKKLATQFSAQRTHFFSRASQHFSLRLSSLQPRFAGQAAFARCLWPFPSGSVVRTQMSDTSSIPLTTSLMFLP